MDRDIEIPHFWEQRYQEGTTRWDLGQEAPPFARLLNSADAPPPGPAAVLGCGRGHDALLFATHGFEVVGFDFAPSAIQAARRNAEKMAIAAEFLQRDIFDLVPEFAGNFDCVIEHTCFCAIPPRKREAYVEVTRSLLRPGGEVIGLFFTHNRPGGPPFGITPEEIKQYFAPHFELVSLELAFDSIPSRRGEEHLGRFRRHSSSISRLVRI